MSEFHENEEGDEFDEESAERDAFQIEEMVEDFVDEPPVRPNEIPESESDGSDDDDEDDEAPRKPKMKGESSHCECQVYASRLPKDNGWKVRLFVDKHSCVPNGTCEMLKVPHIARLFVDKIREEPEYYMPMKIEEMVQEKWGITVSRPQCQAARNKALKWIECEYDHQFARLRDYAAELIHSNKDSSVKIDTLTNEEGKELFNRFYVCFDAIKRTWKETCRPLIGVDDCLMKVRYGCDGKRCG